MPRPHSRPDKITGPAETNGYRLEQLLRRYDARLSGTAGDPSHAHALANTGRFIAEQFVAFNRLRVALVHPEAHQLGPKDDGARRVGEELVTRGLLKRAPGAAYVFAEDSNPWVRGYLAGGWLEAYLWTAAVAAGMEDVRYSQRIEWEVDGVTGHNEIDVIGVSRQRPVFISCKAISPGPELGRSTALRQFLYEAHYWNLHFSGGRGIAAVVTTADLVDETDLGDRNRFPPLEKQARVLDVALLGGEMLRWDILVPALAALVASP